VERYGLIWYSITEKEINLEVAEVQVLFQGFYITERAKK